MKRTLEDVNEGILINGKRLNNLRYADDTAIIANILKGSLRLISRIAEMSRIYGLDFNIKKTKYMIVSIHRICASTTNNQS